ncbi:hypothetical protein [Parasphingorhabdus sp.]
MTKAWSSSFTMFKSHGLLVILSQVIVYVMMGVVGVLLFSGMTDFTTATRIDDPGALPGLFAGRFGLMFLGMLVIFALSLAGYFIAWRIVLSPEKETFAESVIYGLIASLPALFAFIAVYLVFIVGIGLVSLLFGFGFGGFADISDSTDGGGALGGLLNIIFLCVFLFLTARFGTTGPVMASEKSFNPFSAMVTSWKITANNSLMLMLYLFLNSIAFLVIYFVLAAIAVAVGAASMIAGIAIGAVFLISLATFFLLIPAGIFVSLAKEDLDIEDVFN